MFIELDNENTQSQGFTIKYLSGSQDSVLRTFPCLNFLGGEIKDSSSFSLSSSPLEVVIIYPF